MPRVALVVRPDPAPSGPPPAAGSVTAVRLYASVALGNTPYRQPAVIDTGAPLSLISKAVWESHHLRGDIRWLRNPPAPTGEPAQSLPHVRILGGRYPYRLGTIRAVLREPAPGAGELPPVELTAQFVEDWELGNEAVKPLRHGVILGLSRGVLDNYYLVYGKHTRAAEPEAWVQAERPDYPFVPSRAVL